MASILRFDNWQNSDGTSIATTDASGNISFAGSLGATAGTGKILQVVSATKTDQFSTTSTSFVDVPGVSVSITPTSATSKVFVTVTGITYNGTTNQLNAFNIVRDSLVIAQSTGSTNNQTTFNGTGGGAGNFPFIAMYLDSPATTLATTYKLQVRATAGTAYVGGYTGNYGATTTITVMEVAA
jgi:anionic cell wall polymer biosynthesis LytR-Cps2A-Psr (LCP) family protein